MNWLATFFYMLAMVQNFMIILFAAKVMGTQPSYGRAFFACACWPALPVVFLYKVAFNK